MRAFQAAASPGSRRFGLASPPALLVALGSLVLALTAAGWPLADLARLSFKAGTGGAPWWVFTPLGVVGLVVAWRKPGNKHG